MNRTLFLTLTFLCVLHSQAQVKQVPINWQCHQSDPENRPMPLKSQVPAQFSWKGEQAVMNTKAVSDFLERSLKTDFDYFVCNQNFIYQLKLSTENFCETGTTPASKSSCKQKAQLVYDSMLAQNTLSSKKNNLIVPGEPLPDPVTEHEQSLSRSICTLSKGQMSKQYVENSLVPYLKSLDTNCRKRTIESSVKMLAENVKYTCTYQGQSACERIKKAIPELVSRLNQAQDRPISNLCLQPINLPAEIERLKNTIDQASRCQPLVAGLPRIVDGLANPSVPNNYAVTRTKGNVFRIDLKMEFIKYDSDISTEDIEGFNKRLSLCLHTMNQKLLGPNGERLQIQVNDSNAPKGLATNSVSLSRSVARESALRWSPYTSCSTMTHEMMHLLGLVDEYSEKSCGFLVNPKTGNRSSLLEAPTKQNNGSNYVLAYDCRSIGPENSIMSNSNRAMNEVFGGEKEFSKCTCDQKQSKNCGFLKNLNRENFFDQCRGDGAVYENFNAFGPNTPPPADTPNSRTIVMNKYPSPVKRNSILLPSQFRQVIQPNCRQTNGAFMDCSQGSQESSIERACPPKPDYCKDWKKWLQ